eukprot:TRINITY_DN10332_c0_g1_i1.p1 TRINITY_DN10332_c0_g1~~TRINITY_DN10332_c0_g1_i1.p1  ORF type:complete len:284 (+),score=34.85 TRINITY_DN10332_c0_g1_i1:112-963(+)
MQLNEAQEVGRELKLRRRSFSVQNQVSGKRIVGILEEPCQPSAVHSEKVAIIVHGLLGHKNGLFIPSLAQYLVNKIKCSVIRFDCATGTGQSDCEFNYAGYDDDVMDLRAVIQALPSNLKPYIIIGHSKGANEVLMYASKFNDIPYVVSISSRFIMNRKVARFSEQQLSDLQHMKTIEWEAVGRVWKISGQQFFERRNIDNKKISAGIRKGKILLIHAFDDGIIPFEDVEMWKTHLSPELSEKIALPTGNHFFSKQPDRDRLYNAISSWLEKQEHFRTDKAKM